MLVKGLSDRVPQRPLSNVRSRILMITKILAIYVLFLSDVQVSKALRMQDQGSLKGFDASQGSLNPMEEKPQ